MKFKPVHRLAIGTLVCFALSIGMTIVKRGYSFMVKPTNVRLSEAPKSIGNWVAENAELTDAEFGVLNAADVASLRFSDPIGRVAFMHVATWTDPDEVAETCPHHPGVCYAGNGWYAMQTTQIELDIDDVGLVPIEVSLMDRGGERLVIAFTYSMGEYRFSTDAEARLAQAKLWGSRQWPAVTKYLLQLNLDNVEQSVPIIQQLLGEFIRWRDQEEREPSSDRETTAASQILDEFHLDRFAEHVSSQSRIICPESSSLASAAVERCESGIARIVVLQESPSEYTFFENVTKNDSHLQLWRRGASVHA
ncbi:MAG: exosortase C-terminal domain/associated protein EpsI [Planctomycetota bacterium]